MRVLTVHGEGAYVFAILEAGAAGYLLKDVPGNELGLSPRTVQVHLRSVFRRLGVASRTEAVITALREGILRLEELS